MEYYHMSMEHPVAAMAAAMAAAMIASMAIAMVALSARPMLTCKSYLEKRHPSPPYVKVYTREVMDYRLDH